MKLNHSLAAAILVLFSINLNAQIIGVSYASGSVKTFTGKVYLYLSKDKKQPKDNFVGLNSFPCYAISVKNIKPGKIVQFDDQAISYPVLLSEIERGEYYVQAVWDVNAGGRAINRSPGNIYSKAIKINFTQNRRMRFSLSSTQVCVGESFIETAFVKEEKTVSTLLTSFQGKPASINAAVILPKEYYLQPNRKFPVLYEVYGYGGDYHERSGTTDNSAPIDTTPCIRVELDGNCALGHSVYANSDNNGPWGDALVKELIPAIEKKYRCDGARLLTGHSSGGWSVLWLQTQYPLVFSGCWSSSPDPVDFRSFQRCDLYKDENIFYKNDSSLRAVATVAGYFTWVTMKQMMQMEAVISRGEQMHSFDAVFSEKMANGEPRRLTNSSTGKIDHITFQHWKKYDISAYLKNNWLQIKPALYGKIRVSVGNQDNFLLNYPVHLLDDEMKKLDTKFVFAYYPGDHFTIATKEYYSEGNKFLQERYLAFLQQAK